MNLRDISNTPSVIINGRHIKRETIDVFEIFSEICHSFKVIPQSCENHPFTILNPPSKGNNIVLVISIILAVFIALGLIMIPVYRRIIKKEMKKDMSADVNQMVSKYMAFYKENEKNELKK